MSKTIYSDDLMFESGIYSLLGERLISEHFIIVDFDYKSLVIPSAIFDKRREVIGFASNDISYYKAKRVGIQIVLDKRSRIKDVLNFFLLRRRAAYYKLKNTLTLREKETLLLLTDGRSLEDVAEILGVKENTIYTLRRNILIKLKIKNRIEFIDFIN